MFKEGFELACVSRSRLKKDVAADAGVSPQFLADLIYGRAGATKPVAERIAGSLAVDIGVLFPALASRPWTPPAIDRDGRKVA